MSRKTRGDQWQIPEVLYRYVLHPDLREIWVEGDDDAALIGWFLVEHGRNDWRLMPIKLVDVLDEEIAAFEYTIGNRGSVLTLCAAACNDQWVAAMPHKPIFVVDRDLESLEEDFAVPCDLCLVTDFTSMEMYALNVKTLQKFLNLYVRTDTMTGQQLLDAIMPALMQLFLARAALHHPTEGIGIHSNVTAFCQREGEIVVVHEKRLIRASIEASTITNKPTVVSVSEKIVSIRATIPPDPRRAMHGKDFLHLLRWMVEGRGLPTPLRNLDFLARALYVALELDDLEEFSMFQELLRRTAA